MLGSPPPPPPPPGPRRLTSRPGGVGVAAWAPPLDPQHQKIFLRKKLKFVKWARDWRSIWGTQTFLFGLYPPPPPRVEVMVATMPWPAPHPPGSGGFMPLIDGLESTFARHARHPNECSGHPSQRFTPKRHSLLQPRLPNPCRLGGPRGGGMATSPPDFSGVPNTGTKKGGKG